VLAVFLSFNWKIWTVRARHKNASFFLVTEEIPVGAPVYQVDCRLASIFALDAVDAWPTRGLT
jgi:hypothetical protein